MKYDEIFEKDMKGMNFVLAAFIGMNIMCSCGNSKRQIAESREKDCKKIVQKSDGTIYLDLNRADCYNDLKDPSGNTAEWDVVVSKSGRYDVWISSATKDTTNLKYKNPVRINVQFSRLEGHPACDKIVHDAGDVTFPYFRADSFVGSMYLPDTGEYSFQVISDKILPSDFRGADVSDADISKLISVSFKPSVR